MIICSHRIPFESRCPDCMAEGLERAKHEAVKQWNPDVDAYMKSVRTQYEADLED